jgi:hypothetical protein
MVAELEGTTFLITKSNTGHDPEPAPTTAYHHNLTPLYPY